MDSCNEHRVNMLRYLDHELRGRDLETFLAHLKVCEDCKAGLEEEQALSHLLHRNRPLYPASAALRARVAAVVAQHSPPKKQVLGSRPADFETAITLENARTRGRGNRSMPPVSSGRSAESAGGKLRSGGSRDSPRFPRHAASARDSNERAGDCVGLVCRQGPVSFATS